MLFEPCNQNLGCWGAIGTITQIGISGGTGDMIIFYSGSATLHPYSLGLSASTLWYSVPDSAEAIHNLYMDGTSYFQMNSSGASVSGTFNALTALQEGGANLIKG